MKRALTVSLAAALLAATPALAAEKTLTVGYSDALSGGGAVYGVPQKKAIDSSAGSNRSRWSAAKRANSA